MGMRTVVMLNNDMHYMWSNDKDLGKKISLAMNLCHMEPQFHGGKVVEVVHADTVTLAKLSFYDWFQPVAYTDWENKDPDLTLLKKMAENFGYKLVKKPNSK